MKRTLYIGLFVLLGTVAQFIVHAVVEIAYIKLLLGSFKTYSFGISWAGWEKLHHISAIALLAAGVYIGWRQGRYWWRRIYGT